MIRQLSPKRLYQTTVVRDALWLDSRAMVYLLILGAAQVAAVAILFVTSTNGVDLAGKPIGTDFVSFWAASRLALAGTPALAYSPQAHGMAQSAIFHGASVGFYGFFYPPVFLLICLPLACLPYLASLTLWLAATGAFYVGAVRRFLPRERGVPTFLGLGFPAIWLNVTHGQNGFLSSALFATGILLLDKRPIASGLVFGCLIFKPQLAVLLPFAFALRGEWKTFVATAVSAAALMAASAVVLSKQTWVGFADVSLLARATLEHQLVGAGKMVSVFAGMQVLGTSATTAYACQAFVALATFVVLIRARSARVSTHAFGAVTITATLLTTPFALDYDLTLLAIPLAFLFERGCRKGFLPYEKFSLFCGFVLPLAARPLSTCLDLPLAPVVLAAVLVAVARRALHDGQVETRRAHPRSTDPLVPKFLEAVP